MKKAEVQALLQEATQLLEMWQSFKAFLDKALLTKDEITREDESQFLELKSAINRLSRTVAQKLPSDLQFGVDKMADMQKNAISVAHFRQVPAVEVPAFRQQWHSIWVLLTRAAGGIRYLAEGGRPSSKKTIQNSPSKSRGKKSKKKKPIGKIIGVLLVVGAIGFGIAFFMNLI